MYIKCSETSRNPPEASVFVAGTFPEPSQTLPAMTRLVVVFSLCRRSVVVASSSSAVISLP